MPSLRELQSRFSDAVLAAGAVTPTFARGDAAAAAERMAIYRRTIRSNYRNALGATYPVVKRLVGLPFFNAVVDAYVEADPSRSGDLNVYGDTFGDFLAHYAPAAEWPYLPDVARLEWAIDEANRAPDSASPDAVLAALTVVAAAQLAGACPLEPSCRLIGSSFSGAAHLAGKSTRSCRERSLGRDLMHRSARIRREPAGVALDRLPAGVFAWLSALGGAFRCAWARRSAAQDADAAFDLCTALHRFIGDGTIPGSDVVM